ncbi:MAG: aldo/keto reductase [Solirubrobacterales bacterium]|nr:aldo/keto reductase [Solirubrobacterales bacterium]MCB8915171.1 aldo/keto reductase [Thermoleophilales bacterium]
MITKERFKLANDVEIPKLGLGTWFIDDGDAARVVRDAVEIGYRHIDTARAYGNEAGVGEGVRTSGIERSELFVTTKLAAELKSYDEAAAGIDESLTNLGLDYADMMIIHSPKPWMKFHGDDHYFEGNREAWRALEDAYDAGKLRAIGLSNFERVDIDNILGSCSVKPMVNQILVHISSSPFELIEYSQQQDMLVEAYSPIAHGQLFRNEQVTAMAERYGVSVPQLSIRYVLQLGLLPLPKTSNPDHMRSNTEVDFEISGVDMDTLRNLEQIQDYGEIGVMPVFGGDLS